MRAEIHHTEPTLIDFDCPGCGAKGVEGRLTEQEDRLNLLYVVTVLKLVNTYVECSECRAVFTSKARAAEIVGLSPSEIGARLAPPTDFIGCAMAVLALLTCWAPIVGLVMALIALLLTFRAGGWPKIVSIVSLSLTGVAHVFFLFLAVTHR